MLSTTLPLHTVKTNTGMTAVFTVVGSGEFFLGESPAQGSRRAVIDVLSGSGASLERKLRMLEQRAGHRSDQAA